MKSYFFKTKDNYEIHYQVFENTLPTTTFFIHGNLASNRWWYPAQEILSKTALSKNYTGAMVTMEFLGCGKSSAPRSSDDVDTIRFASDFIELIQSYLQSKGQAQEKVNLVGHSAGGLIAAIMTSQMPELFNRAVLLDPVGAKGLTLDENIMAAYEAMKADKDLTATIIGSTIYNNDPNTDFFKQVIIEDTFSAVQKTSYWLVKALHGLDATDHLKNSTAKILVLHGDQDLLLSRDASEELAVKHLQNAKFELIPNHGHCMNVENPIKFVEKISEFLF